MQEKPEHKLTIWNSPSDRTSSSQTTTTPFECRHLLIEHAHSDTNTVTRPPWSHPTRLAIVLREPLCALMRTLIPLCCLAVSWWTLVLQLRLSHLVVEEGIPVEGQSRLKVGFMPRRTCATDSIAHFITRHYAGVIVTGRKPPEGEFAFERLCIRTDLNICLGNGWLGVLLYFRLTRFYRTCLWRHPPLPSWTSLRKHLYGDTYTSHVSTWMCVICGHKYK